VEKHQGTITAHSDDEERGCTFTVQLQLQDREQVRTEPPHLNEPPMDEDNKEDSEPSTVSLTDNHRCSFTTAGGHNVIEMLSTDYFPCHILVVDDSLTNRKMLVRLIRGKFLSVDEAEDGVEAVGKVSQAITGGRIGFHSGYDIILMDYMMPNMDGPTAAKEIRDLGYQGLIIGVTGNALPGDIRHFHNSGADSVLTKPVDMSALMRVISNHFVS